MAKRRGPRGHYLILAAVASLLLAVAFAGRSPAGLEAAPDLFSFTNAVPVSESSVPAGARTIAVDVLGQDIGRVSLLLNTEPLTVQRTGDAARVHVTAERELAPGEYTVAAIAEDATYGRRSITWRFRVVPAGGRLAVPDNFSQVDAKVEIVYPHDGAPVTQADLANVGAQLFLPGTRTPVPCDFNRTVRLWAAVNNAPAVPVAVGTRVMKTVGDVVFPTWEFNDRDVSPARDPANRIFFFVTVDNTGTNNNVWVHAADPRTYFPTQDVPASSGSWPAEVDTRIEIVFPHDGLPVAEAQRANVGVDIYAHGTFQSVDQSQNPFVHLLASLNAGVARYAGTGDRIDAYPQGNITHPRWDINDVDVTAANVSPSVILFRSIAEGGTSYPNVWAHGADARTYFPVQDVPDASCQNPSP